MKKARISSDTSKKVAALSKTVFILLLTLSLLAGLMISFVTSRTPWQRNWYTPSVVSQLSLVQIWSNESLLPSGIGQISDDAAIVAWINTQTTGTTLLIDAEQHLQSSASILLKDYSLFVYTDGVQQVWLHRSQKTLEAYNLAGEILWEHRFTNWPGNAWPSKDGYTLVTTKENETDWHLSLLDYHGNIVWEYIETNCTIDSAVLAPGGAGTVLGITSLNDGSSSFLLINSSGFVSHRMTVGQFKTAVPVISDDGLTAMVGADDRIYRFTDQDKMTEITSVNPATSSTEQNDRYIRLPAGITQLALSQTDASFAAACWSEADNSGWIIGYDQNNQIKWSYALTEPALSLKIHPSGYAVYGGGKSLIYALSNEGALLISQRYADNDLFDLAFSPSGEYLCGLGQSGRLTLWRIPH
ncbi:MAG: hypothetical protein LLG09_00900 [Negativicutes bacterium]|nr:hypothetical protein [Negativicutes bacterium]